jgi:hypothetical protein
VRQQLSLSTAFAVLLGTPTAAMADFVFTAPAGVTDYRIVFQTAGTTLGTSTNIADYNAFVTSEAALSPTLPSATWTMIGATAAVTAMANVSCGALCDATVPIYDVSGNLLATSTNAFFANAVMDYINVDQYGTYHSGDEYVWTGTDAYGATQVGYELGSDAPYLLNWGPWYNYNSEPVLALSSDIGTIPEPMSAALLGFGGAVIGLFRVGRRRRLDS